MEPALRNFLTHQKDIYEEQMIIKEINNLASMADVLTADEAAAISDYQDSSAAL